MCGRITQQLSAAELAAYFEADPLETAPPARFNLAPAQQAIVVIADGGRRMLATFEWGLPPPWDAPPLINARAETVATSPAFAEAFRLRRCIVPADGFFEWQHAGGGRQPFLIRNADGEPLALAGLWAPARETSEGQLPTFTIVTTSANDLLALLHDRMPVILRPEAWVTWLDPSADVSKLRSMLAPAPSESLEAFPVSRRVNDVRNDDGRIVAPLEGVPVTLEQPGLFDGEAFG